MDKKIDKKNQEIAELKELLDKKLNCFKGCKKSNGDCNFCVSKLLANENYRNANEVEKETAQEILKDIWDISNELLKTSPCTNLLVIKAKVTLLKEKYEI